MEVVCHGHIWGALSCGLFLINMHIYIYQVIFAHMHILHYRLQHQLKLRKKWKLDSSFNDWLMLFSFNTVGRLKGWSITIQLPSKVTLAFRWDWRFINGTFQMFGSMFGSNCCTYLHVLCVFRRAKWRWKRQKMGKRQIKDDQDDIIFDFIPRGGAITPDLPMPSRAKARWR